jgi:hypothetical protein
MKRGKVNSKVAHPAVTASYSLGLKGGFQLVSSRTVELLQGLDPLEINVRVILPGVTDTSEQLNRLTANKVSGLPAIGLG